MAFPTTIEELQRDVLTLDLSSNPNILASPIASKDNKLKTVKQKVTQAINEIYAAVVKNKESTDYFMLDANVKIKANTENIALHQEAIQGQQETLSSLAGQMNAQEETLTTINTSLETQDETIQSLNEQIKNIPAGTGSSSQRTPKRILRKKFFKLLAGEQNFILSDWPKDIDYKEENFNIYLEKELNISEKSTITYNYNRGSYFYELYPYSKLTKFNTSVYLSAGGTPILHLFQKELDPGVMINENTKNPSVYTRSFNGSNAYFIFSFDKGVTWNGISDGVITPLDNLEDETLVTKGIKTGDSASFGIFANRLLEETKKNNKVRVGFYFKPTETVKAEISSFNVTFNGTNLIYTKVERIYISGTSSGTKSYSNYEYGRGQDGTPYVNMNQTQFTSIVNANYVVEYLDYGETNLVENWSPEEVIINN